MNRLPDAERFIIVCNYCHDRPDEEKILSVLRDHYRHTPDCHYVRLYGLNDEIQSA